MPAKASGPCVGFGRMPLSQVVGLSEWTAVESAALWCSPLITFTYGRNGSSGFRMGVNSKSAPSIFGVHLSMIAPCGTYTKASRVPEFAAPCAVIAGIIDCRKGKASVVLAPCRNVRREICLLLMNIFKSSIEFSCCLRFPRLEWRALHDVHDDRRQLVIVPGRVVHDAPHDRHVVILQTASQSISHHFFRNGSGELFRMLHQCLAQRDRAFNFRAVRQLAGCIDRARLILGSPSPDAIKVFQRETQRIHHSVTTGTRRVLPMLFHQFTHRLRFRAFLVLL